MKRLYRHTIHHLSLTGFLACAAQLLFFACTDEIYSGYRGTDEQETDGMTIGINVVEQADLLYLLGRTRAASGEAAFDSLTVAATTSTARPLEGNVDTPLYLHRKPLPLMGIHERTVRRDERGDRSQESATRADVSSIVQSGSRDINFHDSLTLWGSVYDPDGGHFRLLCKQRIQKKIRGFRSSIHWPYENDACESTVGTHTDCGTWQGKSMRFCAIAPAYESLSDLTVHEPATIYGGGHTVNIPTFEYTIPEVPALQRDLLFGLSQEIDVQAGPPGEAQYPNAETEREQHLGQDDKVIPLTFYHVLTAIRFAQGKMPTSVTITKIELLSILDHGTFTPDANNLPGTWDDLDSHSVDYTINTNHKPTDYSPSENVYIDNQQVLFLLPHTLGTQAKLRVTLTDSESRVHTLTCSLEGDIWRPGYTVTYAITIGEVANDYYLYVDGHAVTKTGDSAVDAAKEETTSVSGTFSIHSYRNFLDYAKSSTPSDKNYAANWEVTKFYKVESDGTRGEALADNVKPDWLNSITGWTNNGTPAPTPVAGGMPTTLAYTFNAQSSVYSTLDHAAILKNNKSVSGFDLSSSIPDGTKASGHSTRNESANCYIVNAPGGYTFPAVYGNSKGKSLFTNTLFLDHNGWVIKDPSVLKAVSTDNAGTSVSSDVVTAVLTDVENADENTYSAVIASENWEYKNQRAVIIWQDTPNEVIKGVAASSDNIIFNVEQDKMTPCNVIIGLYGKPSKVSQEVTVKNGEMTIGNRTYLIPSPITDTEELLWTWHIWVTDEVYPNNDKVTKNDGITTTENVPIDETYPSYNTTNNSKIAALQDKDGTAHNIMPVNLGWVPKDLTWNVYEPREVWIEVQQVDENNAGGHNTIHLKIRQEAKPDLIEGWSTMYQWGRPTALPLPLTTKSNTLHSIYNSSGGDITNDYFDEGLVKYATTTLANSIRDAIVQPLRLMYSSSDVGLDGSQAYWSTTSKTIYDPCPPGFQMPATTIFTGLSKTGTDTKAVGGLNMYPTWGESGKGGYMYTTHYSEFGESFNRYQPVVYFPTSAVYKNNGEHNTSSSGYYWSGATTSENNYFRLCPSNTPIGEKNNFEIKKNTSGYAMPIRPVVSTLTP